MGVLGRLKVARYPFSLGNGYRLGIDWAAAGRPPDKHPTASRNAAHGIRDMCPPDSRSASGAPRHFTLMKRDSRVNLADQWGRFDTLVLPARCSCSVLMPAQRLAMKSFWGWAVFSVLQRDV